MRLCRQVITDETLAVAYRHVTRNFLGQEIFHGIRALLLKKSSITRKRKAPQGKNLRFFNLETLKNCCLNEKINL